MEIVAVSLPFLRFMRFQDLKIYFQWQSDISLFNHSNQFILQFVIY